MTEIPTIDELTRDALRARPEVEYNERRAYGNILSDEKYGMSQNWDKHLIPENAVDTILSYPTVEEGIARVAEFAISEFYDRNPEHPPLTSTDIAGIYRKIAGRFGLGAYGELICRRLIEARGETVVSALDGDEDAGIDIRTKDGVTYQVKTSDVNRGWKRKQESRILWVCPGEKVVELTDENCETKNWTEAQIRDNGRVIS